MVILPRSSLAATLAVAYKLETAEINVFMNDGAKKQCKIGLRGKQGPILTRSTENPTLES